MKHVLILLVMGMQIFSCSKKKEAGDDFDISVPSPGVKNAIASTRMDFTTKGIGPVESVTLESELNDNWVAEGKSIFDTKCNACHRVGEKLIGPAPDGILERRSPEWIMNMILNPMEMVQKDSLARDLFLEFNSYPMTPMGLTEDDARKVVEYFRTL